MKFYRIFFLFSLEVFIKQTLNQWIYWAKRLIDHPDGMDMDAATRDLSRWIGYFQHERMAYLIVTALFAVLTMMGLILLVITPSWATMALVALIVILLVFHIHRYYLLENKTQELYGLLDQMIDIQREKKKLQQGHTQTRDKGIQNDPIP
ncbi:hypothetical protein LJC71_06980 [Desulfosarcina sp. OttesenSCG-928-A07]|nr:hypothetical protein [Desulfosarcina sp. OttesenSCG-928-A07]